MTITTIIVLRYRVIKPAEHEREQVELTAIAITKYYVAAYFDLVIVNLRVQRTPVCCRLQQQQNDKRFCNYI